MTLILSCAFATSTSTPEHVAVAESLGYRRAWLYDSPALYADVWVTLYRAADRTSRITLGPGVLVPSLRHPMVNAAAIATLVEVAGPERVVVGIGSGFSGRLAVGQRPLAWSYVVGYVRCLRGLLRGEVVEWEGAKMQMMQPAGFGAARPIDVPILLGVAGPKALAAATEVADGIMSTRRIAGPGAAWHVRMYLGTVLDAGETPDSDRVLAAAGHGTAVVYHHWDAVGKPLDALPAGAAWREAYADVPDDVRHLAVHQLHLIDVNDRDRTVLTPRIVAALGGAYTASQLRDRLEELEAGGVTEVAYQPAGSDIPRELEAFARAANG